MKTISKNDVLEIVKLELSDNATPKYFQNNLQEMDTRARWTMQLIQSWGMMAALGDMASKFHDDVKPTEPVPPSQLVMRICEVVDAAWNEMQHRGWILNVDSLGD